MNISDRDATLQSVTEYTRPVAMVKTVALLNQTSNRLTSPVTAISVLNKPNCASTCDIYISSRRDLLCCMRDIVSSSQPKLHHVVLYIV